MNETSTQERIKAIEELLDATPGDRRSNEVASVLKTQLRDALKELRAREVEEAIEEFRALAERAGQAMWRGDTERARDHARELHDDVARAIERRSKKARGRASDERAKLWRASAAKLAKTVEWFERASKALEHG